MKTTMTRLDLVIDNQRKHIAADLAAMSVFAMSVVLAIASLV